MGPLERIKFYGACTPIHLPMNGAALGYELERKLSGRLGGYALKGIRTPDLHLERVASWARLDDEGMCGCRVRLLL